MTGAAIGETSGTVATPTPTSGLSFGDRLADRVNPILVREVQQAVRSKAFIVTLSVALAAICAVALSAALDRDVDASDGREAFLAALFLLAPILTFLIPLQAFLSMRREMRGGTAEQLLLTDLSPRRIVRGKLLAAMVQFVLFASVFGPLLAMTFLLRGVDVPTIAFYLLMAGLACLSTTALAIALGALSRVAILAPWLYAVTAAGLAMATIGLMAGTEESYRDVAGLLRSSDLWIVISAVLTGGVLGVTLLGMIAASILTHPYENRSTPFRVFAFVLIAVAFVWLGCMVPPAYAQMVCAGTFTMALGGLAAFWLIAVSEEDRLSPRIRTQVPRNRVLALLAAPLLPGSSRGLLFVVLSAAGAFAAAQLTCRAVTGAWLGETPFGASPRWANQTREFLTLTMIGLEYAFIVLAVGALVRRRTRPGPAQSWSAVGGMIGLVTLGCILPPLVGLVIDESSSRWSLLHVTNPFWTIEQLESNRNAHLRDDVMIGLAIPCAILFALSVPAVVRGIREVLSASADRRRRAA